MKAKNFLRLLDESGIRFFSGVPDSLLQDLCAELWNSHKASTHQIAPNEGAAVALAAGHYLATGKPGCVYMQNSGQGNAINPLCSLADPEVYSIPMLILVGWRGQPGSKDEPQHVKQGKITQGLHEVLNIPSIVLEHDSGQNDENALKKLISRAITESRPVAAVICKNWFEKTGSLNYSTPHTLNREKAIELIVAGMSDTPIVATTGKISRELFEIRKRRNEPGGYDFLTVGSMGHAGSIALGVALAKPEIPLCCLDGDGAALMHMGTMATIGTSGCSNFRHIILNNMAHESVGGLPTVAGQVKLTRIAEACGYTCLPAVSNEDALSDAVQQLKSTSGPAFLEVLVGLGSRKDLGRPSATPIQSKEAFMACLRK